MDGSKTYRLRLPPNIPVAYFWSVIVYETQANPMLQADHRARVSAARSRASKPIPSVHLMFGLALGPLLNSRRTGSRSSLARAGLRFCASMIFW